MTQKDKLNQARMFAIRVRSIASSIKADGNSYDMTWHRGYCEQLIEAADKILAM